MHFLSSAAKWSKAASTILKSISFLLLSVLHFVLFHGWSGTASDVVHDEPYTGGTAVCPALHCET